MAISNARARDLGYRNAYDYRVHDYGRRPASAPPARGEELSRLRGHRGPADLDRAIKGASDVEVQGTARGPDGRFGKVAVNVTDAQGVTRTYYLKGSEADQAHLRQLGRDLDRARVPATWYPLNLPAIQRFARTRFGRVWHILRPRSEVAYDDRTGPWFEIGPEPGRVCKRCQARKDAEE